MPVQLLLNWYEANRRDLPWRRTSDPYSIWISEIMLQQTQVETAIPYYDRFLHAFPDITSLAEAGEEEVLALWKGLGYYTRARNLHRAAKVIREQYHGVFPDKYKEVRSLPGIGDYSAGAIASIAFQQAYPAVDGNVLRVIARFRAIQGDIGTPQVKKQITDIVAAMIPEHCPGQFNQALMELGATCCLPKNPQCLICPLAPDCEACRTGRQDSLPLKKKTKAAAELDYVAAVICLNDSILMEYRNNTQLLGNMWGLPLVRKDSAATGEDELDQELGSFLEERGLSVPVRRIKTLRQVKHTFSHQVWRMEVILFALDGCSEEMAVSGPEIKPELIAESGRGLYNGQDAKEDRNNNNNMELKPHLAWIPTEKLGGLPIPKAFQKVLALIQETNSNQETHSDQETN